MLSVTCFLSPLCCCPFFCCHRDPTVTAAAKTSLAAQLESTLHREIPITKAMGMTVRDYDGTRLTIAAPLAPNINLHGTGFAGSLYTIAVTCGWSMTYLQLLEAGVDGSIVIADADIKYIAPERGELVARCDLSTHAEFATALTTLRSKGKARFSLIVTVGPPGDPVALFTGRYAVRLHQ